MDSTHPLRLLNLLIDQYVQYDSTCCTAHMLALHTTEFISCQSANVSEVMETFVNEIDVMLCTVRSS